MGNENSERKESKSWLQWVTEQSWEPELLISGLAIYATLNLPAIFKDAYQYYQYNLQSGSGVLDEILPLLIYAVFTTAAYFLATAFITHFIVRAFWVGFIGLMSVYDEGIKYEELPYSDFYKEEARKKLGASERMALGLDHTSSLVFSIAFAGVLIMVAVAILYSVFFLLYNVLKLFVSPAFFEGYISILYPLFLIMLIGYIASILILNMKRFRSNPKLARWHFNLSWNLNAMLMPVVYKPLQFIQLTFLSNISTKKFVTYYVVLFLGFFVVLMGVMMQTLDVNAWDTRNYYATNSSARHVELHEYSAHVEEDELLQNSVIEKPVISSGTMTVFVPYPKQLDEIFNQFCESKQFPESISNYKKSRMINEHNIKCAERLFSFSVDDSLELKSEFMFTKHPKTRQQGFLSYVDVSEVPSGRHTFYVKRESVNETDATRREEGRRLTFENEIPFWIR